MNWLVDSINSYQRLNKDINKYLTNVVEDIKSVGILSSTFDEYYTEIDFANSEHVDEVKESFSIKNFFYNNYSVTNKGTTINILLRDNSYDPEWQELEIPFSFFADDNGWVIWAENKFKQQIEVINRGKKLFELKEQKQAELQKDYDYNKYLELKARFETVI